MWLLVPDGFYSIVQKAGEQSCASAPAWRTTSTVFATGTCLP
jgi:hypothetical protein